MLRLIIADDEKLARDCIVEFVDWPQHGIELAGVASDGLEAYSMIREKAPDIAVVDIQMPGLTGLELIEKLKSENCNTSFIIISSFDSFDYARQAIHFGVEEYLLKPFSPGDLLSAITKVTEKLSGQSPPASAAAPSLPFESDPFSSPNALSYPVNEEKALISALHSGSEEDTRQKLEEFIARCGEKNPESQNRNSCLFILCLELYRIAALNKRSLPHFDTEKPDSQDEEGIGRYYCDLLRTLCGIILSNLFKQDSYSYLVKQSIDYIREHYAEDLSLEVLAQRIFVSPSYLSSLFRQNIGMTYIEYLNSLRIAKAKEIMHAEPHLKNYEVAARIGYSPKYFAQIFKQLEGISLSEYRQRHL